MKEQHRCPHCGVPLGPEGLCTRCLLEQGIAELEAMEAPRGPLPEGYEFLDPFHGKATEESPGRYTDLRPRARGGMGRILIAQDVHLGREVVIKELLGEEEVPGSGSSLPDPTAPRTARFLREARITGQLEHPSIVPVYELGYREDGTLYYTMKYVRGMSLAEAIGEAGDLRARLKLLPHYLDLCQAIAFAHSRGVIHRDIKPSNVMVGAFGARAGTGGPGGTGRDRREGHGEGARRPLRVCPRTGGGGAAVPHGRRGPGL